MNKPELTESDKEELKKLIDEFKNTSGGFKISFHINKKGNISIDIDFDYDSSNLKNIGELLYHISIGSLGSHILSSLANHAGEDVNKKRSMAKIVNYWDKKEQAPFIGPLLNR
jgi:hypothetical protein